MQELEPLFDELIDLQRELARTLAVRAPKEPIYVYLFSNEKEYRDYVMNNVLIHFPEVPYREALYIRRNGLPGIYAFRKDSLDVDLRHECTHALLHASCASVPLWLDEGLAVYFEVPQAERAFDHPHFNTLRWEMRLGMVRPIDKLEAIEGLEEMSGRDYRFAWAWTHFMLHGPAPAHEALLGYLSGIRPGVPPGSLAKRIETELPNTTERMVQHFKHWRR